MAVDRDQTIAAAARAYSARNLDDTRRLASQVLQSNPSDIEALLWIGIVGVEKNDPSVALPALQQVLDLEPSSFDAPFWMSMLLRRQGRLSEALEMAKRAVQRNEKSEHAQNQLGSCLLDLNHREEAISRFRTAIQLDPNLGPSYDNLGRALQSVGKIDEAIQAFNQVLNIGPVRPQALFRLGDAYMQVPNVLGAEQCARAILQMEPFSVQGNLLLARALIGDGRVSEGADYALKACKLAPQNAVPVAYYGRALQSLGRIAEADEEFRKSIALQPRQGFAYHALVHNHKVKEDERPMVDKMEALSLDAGLPRREIIQLEYGLGKAYEDLGEFEPAMRHFDQANRIDHELKVGVAPFSRQQLLNTAEFLMETFTPDYIKSWRAMGIESDVPVFVVGMMRSGTTLAEQILSSHAEIGGAGEQLFWPENAGSSEKLFEQLEGKAVLDMDRLANLAKTYLALLTSVAPGKSRVVDKMNSNYLLLGLLHIAFPNAKIVHMRRHPVDTCLSIWATPVANGIDLCGDKQNVVFAYQQYLRIMEHWRKVIPSDRFLDVQYEELVSDRDRVTRMMIEFCGLPWDEACMKPEDNTRSVKTPSVWQVRQPVYKTSMERWRKYEPWLGPFADLFESVTA